MSETEPVADGLERKLATILSADVAAYSRLMAEDEEGTLRVFRGHKEVFEGRRAAVVLAHPLRRDNDPAEVASL